MADFKRLPGVGIFKVKGLSRRQVEKVKKGGIKMREILNNL